MENRRIESFDVLKGIAILMVVMGHVITYGVYRIDSSVVFRLIGTVHMPLFFFISGYFTVREKEGRLALPGLWKRFRQLIIPMVIVTTLWIYYYPHSGLQKLLTCTFAGLWSNLWKNGYWFTWVLFAVIALYGGAAWVSRHFRGKWKGLPFAVLLGTLAVGEWLIPAKINAWLCFTFIFKYMWVFLFGGVARLLGGKFISFAETQKGYTVSLLLTVALAVFVMYPEWFPFKQTALIRNTAQVVLHCSLATFALGLVYPLVDGAGTHSALATKSIKLWSLLGRRSLQIYLLHYFFLFPLTSLRPVLKGMNLGFIPVATTALIASTLIVAVCLCVDAALRRSRILAPALGII